MRQIAVAVCARLISVCLYRHKVLDLSRRLAQNAIRRKCCELRLSFPRGRKAFNMFTAGQPTKSNVCALARFVNIVCRFCNGSQNITKKTHDG